MRLPELKTIRGIRKRIGINQSALAKAAGVSQSLIARIECGKVDPSFSKVKQIFAELEKIGAEKTMRARDVMNRKIVSINSRHSVKDAAMLMKRKNISQLPVIDDDNVLGSITEKSIVDKIASKTPIGDISNTRVSEVMEDVFPVIDESSPIGMISLLLEYNSAVLVTKRGKVVGIITKADLLKLM